MSTRLESTLRWIIPLLLLAYPASFRQRFGADLTATYLDRFGAAHARAGWLGVMGYLLVAAAHSLRDGVLERWAASGNGRRGRYSLTMAQWLTDLRRALRGLVRVPAFSIIAVGTLALGIGASTTMFSVVDAVLLRPLPYDRSDELVAIGFRLPDIDDLVSVSWGIAGAIQDRADGVANVATVRAYQADVDPDAGYPNAVRLWAASVSSSFFTTLAVHPELGRAFTQAEDRLPEARVLMLSHQAWINRWGADSEIVGRSIVVNGEPYEVVGVMPQGFVAPEGLQLTELDVLFPALVAVADRPYDNFRRGYFRVVARLTPGWTVERAGAELAAIHTALESEQAEVQAGRVEVIPLRDLTVAGAGQTLWPLFGAVILLLIIACVNVVNLFLARATSRQREIAIRAALGAGKSDVIRPLALESLLVALLGAGHGLVLAALGLRALASWSPGDLPRLAEVSLDLRVVAFAVATALVTGLLIGLAPALRFAAIRQDALRSGSGKATNTRSVHRARGVLVVAQTAIALVLLVGAGLMINSFAKLLAVEPGFEPAGVLIAHIQLPRAYAESQQRGLELRRTLLERVKTLPDVQTASTTVGLPLDGFGGKGHMPMTIETAPDREIEVGSLNWVGPDYPATMGMNLAPGGRGFTADDMARDDVAMVNASFVRAFWPEGDVIGQRIKFGPSEAPTDYRTIIGVVGDVRGANLASRQGPAIYLPDTGGLMGPPLILVVRSAGNPETLAPAIREMVRDIAPSAPLGRLETMAAHVARSITAPRFYTLLIGGFAGAALVLAVIGIYGTLSYMVGQRTREIGVRMALGAAPGSVLGLVVGHGAALGAAGIGIGLVAAAGASQVLASFLFEVPPLDPVIYAVAGGCLLAAVLAAALAPARRATRVDPVVALRSD